MALGAPVSTSDNVTVRIDLGKPREELIAEYEQNIKEIKEVFKNNIYFIINYSSIIKRT